MRIRLTGVVWFETAAAFFCFALARRSWFLDLMAFVFVSEVAAIPFTAVGIVVVSSIKNGLVTGVICLENECDDGERVPDVEVGD
jgi:hypothetical protein